MELAVGFNPFIGPELDHIIFTTESQEEIWHSCYFGGEDANRAYNESLSLELKGSLNKEALKWAVNGLIARHESLRSVFSPDGKYMCVFKDLEISIDYQGYSNLTPNEIEKETREYLKQDALNSFDLTNGPLIRVGLLKLKNHCHRLLITAHHIICDGWSQGIMMQELGILYSAKVRELKPDLPDPVPYTIYAAEQSAIKASENRETIEGFWLDMFKDDVPQMNLPRDYPLLDKRTYEGNRFDQRIGPEMVARLKETGIKANCSLVVTIMAAFEIFLYKITGQHSLVLGLPVAGQSALGAKHLIGHCVNLLPLKSELNLEHSFINHLQGRKSANFDAFEHQDLSFGSLLRKLNIERIPGRVPLIPVVLNIDMGLDDGVSFEGLTHELFSNKREFETFELFLNATGSIDDIVFEWSYNKAFFKEDRIHGMANTFKNILDRIIDDPKTQLSQIITKKQPNYEIRGGEVPYPNSTLHELFHKRASIAPNALAIEYEGETISYKELQDNINYMSSYLQGHGVRPGSMVAISLDRSPELIASLFAILQCGASYVPIDTGYPDTRIKLMISDSDAAFFICKRSKKELLHTSKTIFIEDIVLDKANHLKKTPPLEVSANAPAYVIYTSGSTGKPKGVEVAHRNVVNLLFSMGFEPGITPEDKIFTTTTISFDAMVMEIFLPLIHGASLSIVDEETRRDGHLLLKKALKENITMIWGTPTIWQILLDSGWKEPLKIKALIGGEPVSRPIALQLLERCDELWNIYGPTETTVCCFLTKITKEDDPITIGRPVANTHAYLLDKAGNVVNKGEIGEIAIGGDGVTLGYLGRPELTKERFVEDVFQENSKSKMYLSGDLGKLLPNGQVQCMGRSDSQVKLRGYRIELGEIEHALKKLTGIDSAITEVRNNVLICYVIYTGNANEWNDQVPIWKEELAKELPVYMVPQEFTQLDELPVTPNGKLDRKRLPNQSSVTAAPQVEIIPLTAMERIVADVWKECLDLDKVGKFDDFFKLGGHSLIATKVMTELEQKTGQRVPLASLFKFSTVEKFALLFHVSDPVANWDSLVAIRAQGNKPPLFIVHGAGLNVLSFKNLGQYMDSEQPIYALQAKGLNGKEELLTSVEEIASHYLKAILDCQPKGPYILAGYSSGGIIAYEMARQLIAKGKRVSTLALLDTFAFSHYGYSSSLSRKFAKVKYLLGKSFHILKQVLTSWDEFKSRVEITQRNLRNFYLQAKKDKKELSTLGYDWNYEKLKEKHNNVIEQYHLKTLPVKVDLFRVHQVVAYIQDPVHLGWTRFAKKGISTHDMPGEHLTMFSPPNNKVLAKVLQNVIDKNYSDTTHLD